MARYELNSQSSDDEVISTVLQVAQASKDAIDKADSTFSGNQVLFNLSRTEEPKSIDESERSPEWIAWRDAVKESTVDLVMAKRRTENFIGRSDRNDTEALRTPSVLKVIFDAVVENRSHGVTTQEVTAYRAGFVAAIYEGARTLAWNIFGRDGRDGLLRLQTTVDILNARHHSEGWGHIADATEIAVNEVLSQE